MTDTTTGAPATTPAALTTTPSPNPERYPDSLNLKIAGQAGEGIDITGIMFGKLCIRQGMNVFAYREYPSLIRGGQSTHQVLASFNPTTCQQKHVDLLIALNEDCISLHLDEIDQDSIVFCEATTQNYDMAKYQALSHGATFFDVPMINMSREETGHFLAQNVVSLGASVWVLGMDIEMLTEVVKDQFKEKGDVVINKNLKAMQRGYQYAKEHLPQMKKPFAIKKDNPQILLTGNHAVALGAVAGGVQYFSGYPMTPASDVLHTLAAQQMHFPIVVKHAEDEISAINQAIGASYAGVRAMTATATGGYALMVEATSLAAVAETPLVICVGQRPGPATGLPTWTCQADLQFILHAAHGEIPRVVFTPSNVQEHFELTRQAFYLAEKYHLVVFVLSDKFGLESYESMPRPNDVYENQRYSFAPEVLPEDDSYRRFVITEEGYSPRSVPGQAHGLGVTNSYEHDEFGYATESASMTKAMNEKRQRKMVGVAKEVPGPVLYGPETADVTLIGWGSTKMVLEEVVRQVNGAKDVAAGSTGSAQPNFTANCIHFPCIWPFPNEQFSSLATKAKKLVMVEGNFTGQLAQLIRQETGIQMAHHIRRYDGRPFFVEELIPEITEFMAGKNTGNLTISGATEATTGAK